MPRTDLPRLEEMTEEFMECRLYGHKWTPFVPMMRRPSFGWRDSLRCDRCTAERHDLIDSLGNVGQREYRHPEGYKWAGERIIRNDLRTTLLTKKYGPPQKAPKPKAAKGTRSRSLKVAK